MDVNWMMVVGGALARTHSSQALWYMIYDCSRLDKREEMIE